MSYPAGWHLTHYQLPSVTNVYGHLDGFRQVTTSGVPVRAGLFDLDSGFEGTTASGITLFHAPTTPGIAHDASAGDVEELLEMLPSLGQVNRFGWLTNVLI